MADRISMFIALLSLELRVAGSHSLKDKRQVIQSLVETMRRRFNISVAEVDHLDAWQMAGLGVAAVANDKRFLDEVITRVEKFVAGDPRVEIIHSETEIL